jgi:hypothetical protein
MQRLLHDILTEIQSMRDRAPGETGVIKTALGRKLCEITSSRLGKHPKQSHESISTSM